MSDKVYAVSISDNCDNKPLVKRFEGSWEDCLEFAYNFMSIESVYAPETIQDEIEALRRTKGKYQVPKWEAEVPHLHVQGDATTPGYVAYGSKTGRWLQYVWVSISDANPPPPPEPREPFDYNGALRESAALMHTEIAKPGNQDLAKAVRDFDGPGGFMFGFEETLTPNQHERWNKIVNDADKHGHSGASYGMPCRCLQAMLNQ